MTGRDERRSADELPAWRRYSGVAVIAILAIVLVATSRSPDRSPVQLGTSTSAPTDTAVPLAITSSASPIVPEEEVLAATRAALDAWGVFASTGVVDDLDGTFEESGPQYQQLVQESGGIVAVEGVYVVTLEAEEITVTDDSATVSGHVGFGLNAPTDETVFWNIFMVRMNGVWRLSAVEEP